MLGIFTIPLCPRNPGEPLRVLVIGRFSTPHQRQESIEASYEYAEQYLAKDYHGPIKITRLGEQASGMVADRKTIREAEDLIAAGKIDLVLVEDVGRIYRDSRHLIAFVNDTVDAEVRLVAINDGLATAEDETEGRSGARASRRTVDPAIPRQGASPQSLVVALDEHLAAIARQEPRVQLLMTMPGVNYVVALGLLAALERWPSPTASRVLTSALEHCKDGDSFSRSHTFSGTSINRPNDDAVPWCVSDSHTFGEARFSCRELIRFVRIALD